MLLLMTNDLMLTSSGTQPIFRVKSTVLIFLECVS